MARRLGPGFGRALLAWLATLVSTQLVVPVAAAVAPGKNGLLLLAAPQGTTFTGSGASPATARVADCYQGLPNELWTVRPGGGGLVALGRGDYGRFSPDGRMLLTSFSPGCYNANALSLSRAPFHQEHLIPGADFTNASSNAVFGPWLGPDHPTFLDPTGAYRDGITGRVLLPDIGAAGPMSCSGKVADPDGTIATPVRASGRVTVTWRRIPGRGWLGDPNVTTVQWSPDGRYAYFTTWSRSADRLWRVNADASGRRLLFRAPASADLQSTLSPNGRWFLLATLDSRFGQQLSAITADGHGLHMITPRPSGGNINATAEWSPRGDLLLVAGRVSYYSSTPPYGVTAPSFVYVVRPGGGPRRDLSLPGLGVWSPDERFIAYTTSGAAPSPQSALSSVNLVISPVAFGPARTVLTASVPVPLPETSGSLAVADWQAAPGSARPPRCATGRAPF